MASSVKVELDKKPAVELDARYRSIALAGLCTALLALSVFFHLYQLAQVPGWDPEEGYNLDIAWNLAHGRLRLFSLSSAFAEHPPLFYLQLGVSFHFFGYSMLALRVLVAAYAILTDVALFFIGRRLIGTAAALWAMAVYTIAPVMLANTRWGYSYSQLAFVGILCLGATWRYRQTDDRRWLLLAAALAGAATFSDYEGLAWVAFVALVVVQQTRRRWPDLGLALAVGLGIPLLGLLLCLLLAPGVFLADLGSTLGRAAGGNPLSQFIVLLLNYAQFLSLNAWLLLGVVGLFLAPARTRGLLLGAAAILGLVVLKVRLVGLSLHTAVPLLPLLALGAGIAVDLGLNYLYRWLLIWLESVVGEKRMLSRLLATALVFLAVVSPVALVMVSDLVGLRTATFATQQDAILGTPRDAEAVTHYVFAHAHNRDLILASSELAWIFDSPEHAPHTEAADILQTLAQGGESAAFYPAGLPTWRWTYDVSLGRARYVIVDNLLRQLAKPDQLPSLGALLAQAERWPLVFSSGQYAVYERPGAT